MIQELEYKTCKRCGRTLPKTKEYFTSGLDKKRGKEYFGMCRECNKAYSRAYHAEHRDEENERSRERAKEYYKEHKEHVSAYMKEYWSQRPERWRDIHRNEEKRRRARMKQLPATFTAQDWKDALHEFSGACAYCGETGKLTQDHITPISKGGAYTKGNILPACFRCNRSKHSKDFAEWYREQPFYDKEREEHIKEYTEKEKVL